MGDLFLNTDKIDETTTISNHFIDQYMPAANGEFVKIYIHLLRCAGNPEAELSISKLADTFTCTERDVTRALHYWEKLGLLTLTTDEATHRIKGISLEECKADTASEVQDMDREPKKEEVISDTNDIPEATAASAAPKLVPEHQIPQYTIDELATFSTREDVKQLICLAEAYMGKSLSSRETNTFLYFYDCLGFPLELIEYLIEYCVSNGKKQMRYIETVGLKWAEEGITTAEQAKDATSIYSKKFYPIMKSMGLTGRAPGKAERDFIIRWSSEFGFSNEMIIEACNRTIDAIHKPDFRYANSILENWKKRGIANVNQIKALDQEHKAKSKSKGKVLAPASGFSNFEQRDYDYDKLEQQLLAQRK